MSARSAYGEASELFAIVLTRKDRSIYDLNTFTMENGLKFDELDESIQNYVASLRDSKTGVDVEASQNIYRRLNHRSLLDFGTITGSRQNWAFAVHFICMDWRHIAEV